MGKEISWNDRPCEICGKDDVPCAVVCSGVGAISFNTCPICAGMSAEPKGIALGMIEEGIAEGDFCAFYDEETDRYLTAGSKKPCPIRFQSGVEVETRSEAVLYREKLLAESNQDEG